MQYTSALVLKIDVCTHDGMRDGVPRLLDLLARQRVRASFSLAFGPDNSGKAALHLLRPSFARKMFKSSAVRLYGWRTMLSGTLLPARPIAAGHRDLVRRIDGEGHEVLVHAWDHRRWQDHVWRMDEREIESEFERAFACYEEILGRRPRGCGAAAWAVTPASLRVEDRLGLAYASDLRGGPVCRLKIGGAELATPQIPVRGRCIEELLTEGVRGEDELATALVADLCDGAPAVFAIHAEVEGGPYLGFLDRLLVRLRERHGDPRTLEEIALALDRESLPVRELAYTLLPGRSGRVSTSAEVSR